MNYMKHCHLLRQTCPEPMKCGNGCQCVKKDGLDVRIPMDDGGFFDTVDQIVIAARWLLVIFAAVAVAAAGAGYFFGG